MQLEKKNPQSHRPKHNLLSRLACFLVCEDVSCFAISSTVLVFLPIYYKCNTSQLKILEKNLYGFSQQLFFPVPGNYDLHIYSTN